MPRLEVEVADFCLLVADGEVGGLLVLEDDAPYVGDGHGVEAGGFGIDFADDEKARHSKPKADDEHDGDAVEHGVRDSECVGLFN